MVDELFDDALGGAEIAAAGSDKNQQRKKMIEAEDRIRISF